MDQHSLDDSGSTRTVSQITKELPCPTLLIISLTRHPQTRQIDELDDSYLPLKTFVYGGILIRGSHRAKRAFHYPIVYINGSQLIKQ